MSNWANRFARLNRIGFDCVRFWDRNGFFCGFLGYIPDTKVIPNDAKVIQKNAKRFQYDAILIQFRTTNAHEWTLSLKWKNTRKLGSFFSRTGLRYEALGLKV